MENLGNIHPDARNRPDFSTTHWTVVLAAAGPESTEARDAFGRLYQDYWYPLYAYARRRGLSPHQAQDRAQDFFGDLLEKQSLCGLEREGGRFRSFLLRAFENFLLKERKAAQAQKRGGGATVLSLQMEDAEARYGLEVPDRVTPELAFERQWTLVLLARVLARLRAEQDSGGKAALFESLQPMLQGDGRGAPYAEVAERHGMSEGAVKVLVHRLRQRYGDLLRREIARTVESATDVDDELRHLLTVMAR